MDSLFCDAQGRPEGQRTRADGLSGGEAWSITRDVAGRVLSEAGVTPATYEYDGLGHLEKSEVETEPQLFVDQYFTRDPQGSAIGEQDFEDPFEFGELDPPGTRWSHTPAGGGRRSGSEEVWDYKGLDEPQGWNPGHVAYTYDDAGNAVDVYDSRYTHTSQTGWDDAEINTHYRSYSKSYYDAEGRLRVHQINRDSVDHHAQGVSYGEPWGAYEEYWYDALGRRVLKRSRQETPICTYNDPDRCYSSIARYVWDGDQILWELRQANDGDTKDPTGLPLSGQTGHIGYVYAGGIDMPRGMIRNGTTIVLHRNWKGLTTFATDADGEPTTCAPDTYVSESCTPIVSFPGAAWALTQGYEGALDVQVWYGSVTMGHQDRSGLRYQRNRYHDPSAGQFTQLDPIGVAGGLNLYGYANGDPVNFSDPFGLRAELDTIPMDIQAQLGDMCEKIDCNRAEIITDGVVHAGVMKASDGRPVTLGNNIYMASSPDPSNATAMGSVAHELTHVGQYQLMGTLGYYAAAADDRVFEWRYGQGATYDWTSRPRNRAAGYTGATRWYHYSMEQQARMVQDCHGGNPAACALSPYTF